LPFNRYPWVSRFRIVTRSRAAGLFAGRSDLGQFHLTQALEGNHTTAAAPTERPNQATRGVARFRLDWFFSRDPDCANSAVVRAESSDGEVLPDHDAITIEVRHSPILERQNPRKAGG
tara:strand:- start:312 stop:665 length:354 start_codon:yes stop_codon:yes gene_type:complete